MSLRLLLVAILVCAGGLLSYGYAASSVGWVRITVEDAQAWGLLLGVITTSIVSIITALKVDKVHTLVNSAMSAEKAENLLLRTVLAAKELEIAAAEKARAMLAQSALPSSSSSAREEPSGIVQP